MWERSVTIASPSACDTAAPDRRDRMSVTSRSRRARIRDCRCCNRSSCSARDDSAASQSLQNVLGLICDPVGNRVEAPCLGRNVTGAANALSCANMALAGYDHLVPFDQVLDAHRETSERMARELRCTALGGLSITRCGITCCCWFRQFASSYTSIFGTSLMTA